MMPQDIDEGLDVLDGAEPIVWIADPDASLRADLESLQRLYARTLDQVVTLETALTAARTECNKLLEDNRALKRKVAAVQTFVDRALEVL